MDSKTSIEPSTCAPPPVVISGVICNLCSKKFASIKLLNRHKQRVHKIIAVSRKSRIICPVCEERYELKTHEILRQHLVDEHEVTLELLSLQFSSIEEYESWKKEENIDTGYIMYNTNRNRCNDHKEVNYICNRSDSRGYQANYHKRKEKSGGTIKIPGMCPSKLTCKFYDNGIVSLLFWRTHVGHERELRSLHLSKEEQDIIIDKIKSGVSFDRILEEARNLKGTEPQRMNLLNRGNIIYLARKLNIDKKKNHHEMVAASKVQERNGNETKLPVLYKQKAEALGENSVIKSQDEKEIEQLVEQKCTLQISEKLEYQDEREIKWTNFRNWAEALNDEVFNRFMDNIQVAIREADEASNKRKMESQELSPAKKHLQ